MKAYDQKLTDPRWQRKRLEIMQRDNFTCQKCQATTKSLNVHHCFYERGADPWDYPPTSLITLCEPCHEVETKIAWDGQNAFAKQLAALGFKASDFQNMHQFIAGNREQHFTPSRAVVTAVICRLLTDRSFHDLAKIAVTNNVHSPRMGALAKSLGL